MYSIEKRSLDFFVGCSVYGKRNYVYDLYKDGQFVCAAMGIERLRGLGFNV